MAYHVHIVAAGGYVFDKNGNMILVKTHHRGWYASYVIRPEFKLLSERFI